MVKSGKPGSFKTLSAWLKSGFPGSVTRLTRNTLVNQVLVHMVKSGKPGLKTRKVWLVQPGFRGTGTQRQFSENIFSEDDLRCRIFGTFFVKFLPCLPLLGFSNI